MDYKPDKQCRGGCCMNKRGCAKAHTAPLNTYDWLCDIPESLQCTDYVEVQFKNTRKGYYLNSEHLELAKGDSVAVESNPGHDIGIVTLTGKLVLAAMRKHRFDPEKNEIRRIYRLAKQTDLDRWEEAKSREYDTMIQSREIAISLGLDMKIGDVEYQGDGSKAIFYYIADQRIDFRQLIRVLADTFRIRVEMKQIGARQEAGRIGGIGSCGRQLCCSAWMSNFVSVGTGAARYQDLSLNPTKLTGQCAKLKCCLNFEVDAYVEAIKKLPARDTVLETQEGEYYHFKTDTFRRMVSYSKRRNAPSDVVTIPANRAIEIINMNKRGEKPATPVYNDKNEQPTKRSNDILDNNSLTRFDGKDNRRGRKRVVRRGRDDGKSENKTKEGSATPSGNRGANALAPGNPKQPEAAGGERPGEFRRGGGQRRPPHRPEERRTSPREAQTRNEDHRRKPDSDQMPARRYRPAEGGEHLPKEERPTAGSSDSRYTNRNE